ncbi:MAG: hypothetical protein WBX14_10110 [Candidatus Udaeobacter sp.]
MKEKIIAESKQFLWVFVYLWLLLGLFSIHKSIILQEPDLIYHQGFAIINALVLAKIMLIAEMLHVADNLKRKPLIYPIAFKSAVFSVILITFSILEETLTAMWHGKAVSIAMGGGSLRGILVVGVIMFVVLMPFFALKEIGRDIGDGKLYELFFIRRTKYTPEQPLSAE